MDLNWEKVSSKEIHKNPWYRLMQDDVLMPSGQLGKYTYIDRATGVVIAALTPENEIYLVGQYRYPIQKMSWEIPMGSQETGDADFLASAKRELLEELGLEANSWEEIGSFYFCSGVSNQEGKVFLARELVEKEARPDYTEFLTMQKVNLIELEKMIENEEIHDGNTIAAYFKLQQYLRSNQNNG